MEQIASMDHGFHAVETARLRQMTAEEKLRALDALRRTALLLAEAGTRLRHPDLAPDEVRAAALRLLADGSA